MPFYTYTAHFISAVISLIYLRRATAMQYYQRLISSPFRLIYISRPYDADAKMSYYYIA